MLPDRFNNLLEENSPRGWIPLSLACLFVVVVVGCAACLIDTHTPTCWQLLSVALLCIALLCIALLCIVLLHVLLLRITGLLHSICHLAREDSSVRIMPIWAQLITVISHLPLISVQPVPRPARSPPQRRASATEITAGMPSAVTCQYIAFATLLASA